MERSAEIVTYIFNMEYGEEQEQEVECPYQQNKKIRKPLQLGIK